LNDDTKQKLINKEENKIEDFIKKPVLIKNRNNYEIVIDRREAIKRAIDIAKDDDMVLILGKGNETYEKLAHEVIYFNDVEEALKAVEERKSREKIKVE